MRTLVAGSVGHLGEALTMHATTFTGEPYPVA